MKRLSPYAPSRVTVKLFSIMGRVGCGVVVVVLVVVVVVVEPVHAVPLRVNTAGDVGREPDVALKPNDTVAPVAMAPFHAALTAVTWAPDWVCDPFHDWVIRSSPGNVHDSRHPFTRGNRSCAWD